MIREYFIVQCESTGEFLASDGSFCLLLQNAAMFTNPSDAVDTAINELNDDYCLFSFLKRVQLYRDTWGVSNGVGTPQVIRGDRNTKAMNLPTKGFYKWAI